MEREETEIWRGVREMKREHRGMKTYGRQGDEERAMTDREETQKNERETRDGETEVREKRRQNGERQTSRRREKRGDTDSQMKKRIPGDGETDGTRGGLFVAGGIGCNACACVRSMTL